jgi:CheY-like chemotaxis protein
MTALRLLHVDDEPDIREVVAFSLSLDRTISVRSCASGLEALAIAADWSPDIILCDVMMPTLDGPATLARLRECPRTADIPVVFMTARAQFSEIQRFKLLGAVGVIAKPFDPLELGALIRSHLSLAASAYTAVRGDGDGCPEEETSDSIRARFLQRLSRDADVLCELQSVFVNEPGMPSNLNRMRDIAHGLAGAGGVFGFPQISGAAADLEQAVIVEFEHKNPPRAVDRALEKLLTNIAADLPRQLDKAHHPAGL